MKLIKNRKKIVREPRAYSPRRILCPACGGTNICGHYRDTHFGECTMRLDRDSGNEVFGSLDERTEEWQIDSLSCRSCGATAEYPSDFIIGG